jgi:nucleotide-binding universal stress UspA family protein
MTTGSPFTTAPPTGAVAVGVGLDDATAAITWAAAEACRSHRPLHLVHALRVSAAEAYAAVYQGAFEAADERLQEALAQARLLVDGQVPVTAERIDDGWLTFQLTEHMADAAMVVLQHRRMGRWQRLVAGSTVAGVAARCPVPVVSVPEGWTPTETTDPVVSVGVQDQEDAAPLIRQALRMAAEGEARVVVIHAWWLYGGYDSVVADEKFCERREREAMEQIMPGLELARRDFPAVPLTLDVQHATPVTALLDAATDSQLVVLGRRHHRLPIGSHLGPVTRSVLRDSGGPVLVHPELRVAEEVTTDDLGRIPVAALA